MAKSSRAFAQSPAQAASAASLQGHAPQSAAISSAADAYRTALGFVDDIYDDQETVLSIAVAGSNNTSEEAVCEMRLFNVIARMTEDITLIQGLRASIATLAKHAGLTVEVQS